MEYEKEERGTPISKNETAVVRQKQKTKTGK